MTFIRAISVTLPLLSLLQGCGPQLRLEEEFTPKRVREIKFGDRCQLQPYFDNGPPPLRRQSELVVSSDHRRGKVFGNITFVLESPEHRDTFLRLVNQLYDRMPAMDQPGPVVAIVPFLRRKKAQEHLPIHAEIRVEMGEDNFTLPYSPCMSAFFYGREYYEMRRQTIVRQPLG